MPMTPSELSAIRVECAEAMGLSNRFVLMKRGLYYRPEGHGYTANIAEAWVLLEHEANKHVYPHDEPVTKHPAPVPEFESDANAALTLAKALADEGWRWRVQNEPDQLVTAIFFRGYRGTGSWRPVEATAPTFELALCQAFLAVASNAAHTSDPSGAADITESEYFDAIETEIGNQPERAAPTRDHLAGSGEAGCPKPGCGAANKPGQPCSDFDCPRRTQPTEATATAPSVSEAAREIVEAVYFEFATDEDREASVESIITRITGEQAKRIAELEADKELLDKLEVYLQANPTHSLFMNGEGKPTNTIRVAIRAAMKEQP